MMLGDCKRCGHPWVKHTPNAEGGYSCKLCKCKRSYPDGTLAAQAEELDAAWGAFVQVVAHALYLDRVRLGMRMAQQAIERMSSPVAR